ncbi:gliding motility-associated C-terminal domain-containing protein [Bacteroidota bacterium]
MNSVISIKNLLLSVLVFMFSTCSIMATHIVGGEFELIHLDGYLYQLNLIQYFDNINGDPGAEDTEIFARIFRKRDNYPMALVTLTNTGYTFVPYTNIECTVEELETRRILYSIYITLSPEEYDDPYGYYISWERCCRNNIINNIERPDATGQTFYLEFPPVVIDGEPFINSSPILFPPLSDYACINDFYYVDFTGYDPDGDSLVYSMAHPIAGYSSADDPMPIPPHPRPYPLVNWVEGISTSSSIPGNPPLSISGDGLLTVIPNESGLFVFSVLCEEYRDSVKIGEVRRDFQLLVLDCPDPGIPPVITVKPPESDQYVSNLDTLNFSFNDEKCLDFMVKDGDGNEPISLRVKPVNFKAPTDTILSVTQGLVRSPTDSMLFEICFPDCPYTRGKPYIIDLIASDDACPLPLLDTVRMIVNQQPPPNNQAYFTNPQPIYTFNIREGDIIELDITGIDADNDSMVYEIIVEDFTLEEYNMQVQTVSNVPGDLKLKFYWDSDCRKYDFNKMTSFDILFVLDDYDYCQFEDPDHLRIKINVELPPNTKPYITTTFDSDSLTMRILDQLTEQVVGRDDDGDEISLRAEGIGFNLQEAGFSTLDLYGISEITSDFTWKLECNTIDPSITPDFEVLFSIEDHDKCKIDNGDSTTIKFAARLPDNNKPQLYSTNFPDGYVELTVGDEMSIQLEGIDIDSDSLFLSLLSGIENITEYNMSFSPATGRGFVETSMDWVTLCEYLDIGFSEHQLDFTFLLEDDRCLVRDTDTLDFTIVLKDLDVDKDTFIPPNVITPNRDVYNEFFTLPDLPADNCGSLFEYITIHNRYGKEVFFSANRDFKWNGGNVSSGEYFYLLKFSKWEYKGILSVIY